MKKYIPRNWQIWIAAITAILIVIPSVDMNLLRRFVTIFLCTQVLGWAVLRITWTTRTADTNGLERIVRDASYAAIIVGGFIASASLSL